jgi:cell division protein FtsB
MNTRKSSTNSVKDMATKDPNTKEITSALLNALENDVVIQKLASALSVSLQLIIEEQLSPLVKKLDAIAIDNKALHKKLATIEQQNADLKAQNVNLQTELGDLKSTVNVLEQAARKCNVVISGVKETFAEKVTDPADGNGAPATSREDTVRTVCSLLSEACKLNVAPSDIQFATRLKTKHTGPRPLLVGFHSSSLRTSVVTARQRGQTLSFAGSSIYINDHLTHLNSDLAHKARLLVKQKNAHSTWTRDGQVYIKWAVNDRAMPVRRESDLS